MTGVGDAPATLERQPVGPRDDGPHEHGGELGWIETTTVRFFDPASGFAGIGRVEVHPADAESRGAVHLFTPEGHVATVLTRQRGPRKAAVSAGSIEMEAERPLRAWRVRCEDTALVMGSASAGVAVPLALDLAFETWTEPEGFVARRTSVDALKFVTVISSGWFEQAGRITGAIRLGQRQTEIDGVAFRDRVWGNGFALEERWALSFGPELMFARTRFTLEGRPHDAVWHRGRGVVPPVRTTLERTDDSSAAIATVNVSGADGARHEILGESIATIAPSADVPARVWLIRFGWEGRDALGLVEEAPVEQEPAAAAGEEPAPTEPGA